MTIYKSKKYGRFEEGTVISVVSQEDADQYVRLMEESAVFHDRKTITDGYSEWSIRCPMCNRDTMEVVRPGKVQCAICG